MKKSNWRWWLCGLLFVATTVNYLDRQVLSLTWKDFIAPEFHWSNSDYGSITAAFSLFYAFVSLFSGKFIDWVGTKKGYLIAIFVWSLGACMHACCGWLTMHIHNVESIEALRLVEQGSGLALAISSTSVWLFMVCRMVLAIGRRYQGDCRVFPKERPRTGNQYLQLRSLGRCSCSPHHNTFPRSRLWLGMGFRHHWRPRLRLDVFLGVHVRQA